MIGEEDFTGDAATLYTQAGCAESARVRAWLTERGVAFVERDVTTDPGAARALYEGGTFATPLLLAGDAKVLGFRPRELAAAVAEMATMSTPDTPEPTNDAVVPATSGRRLTSYAVDKAKILARLRRMEGQVRGVQRMVEADQYCPDVLTQLSAIIAAARTAGLLVLEDHIRGCVTGMCHHDDTDREEILDELNEAIERFTRTAS